MKYLGIDGGGTKTSFCLVDENLDIMSEYETSGCYYPTVGKEGIINVLKNGIDMCLKNTNVYKREIKAYCGLPAYGELDSLTGDITEIRDSVLPIQIGFCNDVEVCHVGSMGGSPGITVVAGTGSIAFGHDEAGGKARSGGFGPEVNGDEGSAHYIGLKLIQKFTRQADHREEKTLLYSEVKKALRLKKDFDICSYMLEKIRMDREEIAKLALTAYNIAQLGDPVCKSIFNEAAQELYLLASAVKKQLDFYDLPVRVSYAGGVYKAGDLILSEFKNLLARNEMVLMRPRYSPAMGACILARYIK